MASRIHWAGQGVVKDLYAASLTLALNLSNQVLSRLFSILHIHRISMEQEKPQVFGQILGLLKCENPIIE